MYDIIFVTNIPSFYKINLYNELNEVINIKVIFISDSSIIRTSNFLNGDMKFDYEIITEVSYENRNKIFVFYKLITLLMKYKAKQIVFSGWESIEAVILMFIKNKDNNGIVIESSILESSTTGYKGFFKKIIINRCLYAYPSGYLQREILQKLKFKGISRVTNGVGLLNRSFYYNNDHKVISSDEIKFIYIGRLAKEKNLYFLINAFNINKRNLTIVGEGPEYLKLKKIAHDNIKFVGYVDNDKIKSILMEHDVFILPSISEPWGLVVEEAIYSGLPVLVSENVGCKDDLVNKLNTGLSFDPSNILELNSKVDYIIDNYNLFANVVNLLRYEDRANKQIKAYL